MEKILKVLKPVKFHSLKDFKSGKLDSFLDEFFTSKDSNDHYGVYLMTEN